MPDSKIILSADITCDLGTQLQEKYNIHYFPLHIVLDGVDYQDNVNITPADIFEAYQAKKILPKTASINVGEYLSYFKPLVDQGYEVVHINLSSGLSASYQNCCLAAEALGGVYPVDSRSLSTGAGLLVIEAAKLIAAGKLSAAEIATAVTAAREKVHASFIINTLEFMTAGGRCSQVAAFGANMLHIKPCIEVDNKTGSMGVGRKYRGHLDRVLEKYVADQLDQYTNICPERIFITHSGIDKGYIDLVKQAIRDKMDFQEVIDTTASCTICSHCGPNTLGILFMTK